MGGKLVGWSLEKGFDETEYSPSNHRILDPTMRERDRVVVISPGLMLADKVVVKPTIRKIPTTN